MHRFGKRTLVVVDVPYVHQVRGGGGGGGVSGVVELLPHYLPLPNLPMLFAAVDHGDIREQAVTNLLLPATGVDHGDVREQAVGAELRNDQPGCARGLAPGMA